MGPSAWMTWRALSLNPGVSLACPVGQWPILAQAAARSGPDARWIAPQTPAPGARPSLAAFTMASTSSWGISPSMTLVRSSMGRPLRGIEAHQPDQQDEAWNGKAG